MGLSIKHAETEALARKLARKTGKSITATIYEALREKAKAVQARKSNSDTGFAEFQARIREITAPIASLAAGKMTSTDHGDLFYDEMGFPK